MNKYDYNNLTPFKWFVLENFPFIEADFDALTNWQLFCKLGKEMNKIINTMNNLGQGMEDFSQELINSFNEFTTEINTTVEDYITRFNQLKDFVDNYFDNLDVQEEINNKLDDMVEAGTLQEIITNYLNAKAIFCFDTVEDMKEATNLIDGSFAQTLGFYAKDDEGGSIYKIREPIENEVIDNATKIELDNELIAELQYTDELNLKQFGAKGDNLTNETALIQIALDYISNKKGKLIISNGTFLVDGTTGVLVKSDTKIDFRNAKLKAIPQIDPHYQILYILNSSNIVINDAVIEGERDEHLGEGGEYGFGVYIQGNSKNIYFNNLSVSNCWGDGIFFYRQRIDGVDYIPNNVYFNGTTYIKNCRRQGVSILAAENIYFDNLIAEDINGTLPMAVIDLESEASVDLIGNIRINYLKGIRTNKCFTMRTRSKITGDITIGTIEQVDPITIPSGNYDVYVAPFRVFFEYFNNDQGKYKINVDNIYAEYGTFQLYNLYNGCTPKVNIGNIYTKNKIVITDADPNSKALFTLIYDQTTDLSNELGNLVINNIFIENVKEIQERSTSIKNYVIEYQGETSLSSLSLTNVIIKNVEFTTIQDSLTIIPEISNVLFKNVDIHTSDETTTIIKQDTGNKTQLIKNNNKYIFVPATDGTNVKSFFARIFNTLKHFELITKGNTNVIIDPTYNSTLWQNLYLNGVPQSLDANNRYNLGNYTTDTHFIVKTKNSDIYVETY